MNAKSNKANIDEQLAKRAKEQNWQVISIGSQWNGNSFLMRPVLESLEQQYGSVLRFTYLDIEKDAAKADALHVHQIPTLLLVRNGEIVERLVGIIPKYRIIQKIEALLFT